MDSDTSVFFQIVPIDRNTNVDDLQIVQTAV